MTHYKAERESLAAHPTPSWWRDAKLGVMVTWGLFSVPAYAPRGVDVVRLLAERPQDALSLTPYAEWYENSLKFEQGPTAEQHRARFGDRPYASFKRDFEEASAHWDPGELMAFIEGIGAKYVIPVLKHHDSYCLWPTQFVNPLRGPDWHAPRNWVREMAEAARRRSLAFGVYYSAGLDWTLNPEPIANLGEMRAALPKGDTARAMMRTHIRELIEIADPDIIWNDIGYPDEEDLHRLLADYYNGREERLVNDRFQLPTPQHAMMADPEARRAFNEDIASALNTPGFAFAPDIPDIYDFRTPEYAVGAEMGDAAWETVRGVGHSFGYKANEISEDFLSPRELITMFLKVVGSGGNLLINIGPRADGSIPAAQRRPLEALGRFLVEASEGIFGTRPFTDLPKVEQDGTEIFCVGRKRQLYALVAKMGEGPVRLPGWGSVAGLETLGGQGVSCRQSDADLVIDRPATTEPHILRIRR